MSKLNDLEQSLLSDLLTGTANNAASGLNKFSTWFGVSLSASIVLVISNIDNISPFFDLEKIKISIYLLLAAILVLIVQKYISAFLNVALKQSELERELEQRYGERLQTVDVDLFRKELLKNCVFYLRPIFRLSVKKGTLIHTTVFKSSQVLGTLILLQLLLVLLSLLFVTLAIKS